MSKSCPYAWLPRTGEVYEAVSDKNWTVKVKVWQESHRQRPNSNWQSPIPSPIPSGHNMFRGHYQSFDGPRGVPAIPDPVYVREDGYRLMPEQDVSWWTMFGYQHGNVVRAETHDDGEVEIIIRLYHGGVCGVSPDVLAE
jgi:hypothetical protein